MHFSKRFIHIMILIIAIAFFIQEPTFAHNGGRDELGGHFRSSDCTYILHDPSPLAITANNINELITLIKEHNSNSKCSSSLTGSKIDLEGYNFAKSRAETSTKPVSDVGQLQIGEKYKATLEKCTDGDTATFSINGKNYKTRFLYIDTPESTNQIEPFGKEASAFTCNFLKNGRITLETDGRDLYDKYDRLLAWVWVNDQLHQEEITKVGLVEDFYDYGNYQYEDRIISAMMIATEQKIGIYSSQKSKEPKNSTEKPVIDKENKTADLTPEKNQVEKSNHSFTPLFIGLFLLLILFIIYKCVKSIWY